LAIKYDVDYYEKHSNETLRGAIGLWHALEEKILEM